MPSYSDVSSKCPPTFRNQHRPFFLLKLNDLHVTAKHLNAHSPMFLAYLSDTLLAFKPRLFSILLNAISHEVHRARPCLKFNSGFKFGCVRIPRRRFVISSPHIGFVPQLPLSSSSVVVVAEVVVVAVVVVVTVVVVEVVVVAVVVVVTVVVVVAVFVVVTVVLVVLVVAAGDASAVLVYGTRTVTIVFTAAWH